MVFRVLALFLAFLQVGHSQRALSRCINLYSMESCFALYNPLKTSLLSSDRNLFKLSQAFYPVGVFASTSLINVLYTVNFTASDESSLPSPCPEINLNSSSPVVVNDSALFSVGWSSAGVFNIISPLELSKLQLQLLNELYSFFIVPGGGIVLPGSFPWSVKNANGEPVSIIQNNILKLSMILDLSNLPCIPDTDLTKRVLQDITIFLKVYASTEGRPPERIEEGDLGFATGSGTDIKGAIQITFSQTFPVLFIISSVLLGFCVFLASSAFFPMVYKRFSTGRRQFGFYFSGLSLAAFFLNIAILVLEAYKLPQWCNTTYINLISSKEETGCDSTVILELVYQFLAVIFSLIAALVIFFNGFAKTHAQLQTAGCFRKTRYVLGFWMIILMLTLLTWGVIPSILLLFVYPSIVLSFSALITAAIFWSTVMFSIPLLFVHNIRKDPDHWVAFQYFIRLGTLSIVSFLVVTLTVSYLSATVFGSGIGGIVGISIAIVPSLLLTIFSENYRDWVLTNETNESERSVGKFRSLKWERPKFFRSKSSSVNQKKATSKASTLQQESETVLESNQLQLQSGEHGGSNNTKSDVVELEVISTTVGPHEHDDQSNQPNHQSQILVGSFPEKEGNVTPREVTTHMNNSKEGRQTLPANAAPASASHRGLHRNDEPSHQFIRTLSSIYNRK